MAVLKHIKTDTLTSLGGRELLDLVALYCVSFLFSNVGD